MTTNLKFKKTHPQVELRPADEVMRLSRMGAFFPTRLSFSRTMIRFLANQKAEIIRPLWEIDKEGFGRAIYSVCLGGYNYSLVAFATMLAPERRTDRVIAEAWDTSYVLYDGIPNKAELERLQNNAPKQEAGRFMARALILSRANKSVRIFEHVVDNLSNGKQPDENLISSVGYLMRTTAVYGNGKFGTADRERVVDRPGFLAPFQAEMLTVWLIRGFTHDLVEYIAECRAPETFIPLDRRLMRHLGIGNATGLGMAPFLVNHPILINNWMMARETALARLRAIEISDAECVKNIRNLIIRVRRHLDQWNVDDVRQMARIKTLRREFEEVETWATPGCLKAPYPWDRLVRHSSCWSQECQELIVALIMEPHGQLIDDLADDMSSNSTLLLEPAKTVGELCELIEQNYQWALDVDFENAEAQHYFWYVSEEKLEPRLGVRLEEPGADLELPLDLARRVQALAGDLESTPDAQTIAEFLIQHPCHRYITRRVQATKFHLYSEIRDNLIGADCMPIDMLRCKLSFFGASKFDPKSDRWTRIALFQGAPLIGEISSNRADDWWLPVIGNDL